MPRLHLGAIHDNEHTKLPFNLISHLHTSRLQSMSKSAKSCQSACFIDITYQKILRDFARQISLRNEKMQS